MANPFKPTAGARPPVLVGRERTLDGFVEALDDGPGAPALLTRITGQRGTGKTVLLSEVETIARARGWAVVSETATRGLLGRIDMALTPFLDEIGDGPQRRRITGVTVGAVGVATDLPPRANPSLREAMTKLTTLLRDHGTGLAITIDEIHAIDRADLLELAAITQHLVREDLPVALIVAGLPQAVEDLLNEDVATFLRRADPIHLGAVAVQSVRDALVRTFAETGVTLTASQVNRAAAATGGYPFLIQLVGYQVWRLADDGVLTEDAVDRGIDAARRRLGQTVIEPALSTLSGVDRTFLLKMAVDDGPSRTADIAERMNQNPGYVSVYRQRLLAAGVITAPAHGLVDFFLPDLRDYLRQHIATDVDVEPR